MLKRIRRRPSPGTVLGAIALFVALGGGYAMAFAGSGTLQKGNQVGFGASFETVRSLTGIGSIDAKCEPTDNVTIRFRNTSGEVLRLYTETVANASADLDVNTLANNVVKEIAISGGNDSEYRFHPIPTDGSKSPQADILVAVTGDDCVNNARVGVLALNTQQ